jgi:DNA primase
MSNLAKFYEEIRSKCRVSEIIGRTISLAKKGSEYLGLCPFHNEKSPSFTINDIKEFYHCFGCGAHGDVIKFISEKYRISYNEAATKLAEENGIEVRKLSKKEEELYQEIDVLYSITEMSANFYRSNITNEVKQYLEKRSIKPDLIEKFEIGFAQNGNILYKFLDSKNYPLMMMNKAGIVGKDESGNIYDIFRNRIIFPIRNIYNKVVGFGGRIIGEGLPKYINSPDNILFHKCITNASLMMMMMFLK